VRAFDMVHTGAAIGQRSPATDGRMTSGCRTSNRNSSARVAAIGALIPPNFHWEAVRVLCGGYAAKLLKSLVGAPGLEPGTR
jgi:hypothetical protein